MELNGERALQHSEINIYPNGTTSITLPHSVAQELRTPNSLVISGE